MNQGGGGGSNFSIYGTARGSKEEEERHLQGQVLQLCGARTLCLSVPQEERQGRSSDSKATPAKAEKDVETDDDCSMSVHAPLEKRWGDSEL